MLDDYLNDDKRSIIKQIFIAVVVRCNNVKNGKEASEVTGGRSNKVRWGRQTCREKEIRIREKDGLKITDNSIM